MTLDDALELINAALGIAAKARALILVIGLPHNRETHMCVNETIAHRIAKLEANGRPYAIAEPNKLHHIPTVTTTVDKED